ncbi:MAG: hypothetical protein IJS50_06000, partial [Desulfovibrio sp.]|nr:hypothetical protein [Desulfovibrio sp.]
HNCETSLSLEFAKSSPIVTDLDHNGLAEVWLTYYLACRGDVSPEGMKIIMYENGQKYALRGETFLHVDGQDLGGKYQLDSAFKKAPEVFRRFADQLWQKQKRHISE